MAIEIVDFPMKNGDFPSPEGIVTHSIRFSGSEGQAVESSRVFYTLNMWNDKGCIDLLATGE